MTRAFVRRWRSVDSQEAIKAADVDLIAPACYALSGHQRLSVATRKNLETALTFTKVFPMAHLAYGNCSYVFPGAERVESELKRALLSKSHFRGKLFETTITNSVNEAEGIKKVTKEAGLEPKCILIITGELHTRAVRFIWSRVFPNARILVTAIGYQNEFEPRHLIPAQRTFPRWLRVTLGRQLLLQTVGLNIRHLHHRSSHKGGSTC